MKPFDIVFYFTVSLVAAMAPVMLALMLGIHVHALRAYIWIGHWPTYGNPQPDEIPFADPPINAVLGLIDFYIYFGCLGGMYLLARGRGRVGAATVVLASFVAFNAVAFYLSWFDPFGTLDWFFD